MPKSIRPREIICNPEADRQKDILLKMLGFKPANVRHTIILIETADGDSTMVGCAFHSPDVMAGWLRALGYSVISKDGFTGGADA